MTCPEPSTAIDRADAWMADVERLNRLFTDPEAVESDSSRKRFGAGNVGAETAESISFKFKSTSSATSCPHRQFPRWTIRPGAGNGFEGVDKHNICSRAV